MEDVLMPCGTSDYGHRKLLSRAFIDFIMGPIGKPIMESYGFVVPERK